MLLQLISNSFIFCSYVAKFVKKSERVADNEELTFTNLFVRNLDGDITEDLLRETFSPFGKVSSAAIVKDDRGNSKGFGFVKFESPEEAKKAAATLNGSILGKHNNLNLVYAQLFTPV